MVLAALRCSLTMGVFRRVQRVCELRVVLAALTCSLTMGVFCRVQRVCELRVVLAALRCSLTMGVFCRVQRVRELRVVLAGRVFLRPLTVSPTHHLQHAHHRGHPQGCLHPTTTH